MRIRGGVVVGLGLVAMGAVSSLAQVQPVQINVVVTITATPGGGTSISTSTVPVTSSGASTTGAASSGASTVSAAGSSGTVAAGGTSSTSTAASGTGASASVTSTPGCASAYPQALSALATVQGLLVQAEGVYAADHASGVVGDSTYKAGSNNLLGIGLDAGAAHDMVQLGGAAADIGVQIATVQGELGTVTNADLAALVAQMQAGLSNAAGIVAGSAGCAASVAQ